VSESWYYADDDESIGPLGFDGLLHALRLRSNPSRTLVWTQGFEEWVEATTVVDIRAALAVPPPIPKRFPVASTEQTRSTQAQREEARPNKTAKQGPFYKIAGVSLIVLSAILGKALGGAYWMPALLIALSIWALSKLRVRDYAAWMLGVLVGHTLWMIIGHATLYFLDKPDPDVLFFLVDLVLVVGFTAWGLRVQSLALSVAVLAYQLLALATNVANFDEYARIAQIGIFVHIALRLIGGGLAIYSIIRIRRDIYQAVPQPTGDIT